MIDYLKESQKFKPDKVTTLLIGEAPPPNEKTYFYVPQEMNPDRDIRSYSSLPATIFYHYFKTIPDSIEKYKSLLCKLCEKGIFLIDICDEPLKIRDRNQPGQINQNNLNILIGEIPKLKGKITKRIDKIDEQNMIFLLPRPHYRNELRKYFPISQYYCWIEFRLVNNLANTTS